MSLWELSIRRPVLATVLFLALLLFGWIGYSRLPVRELPDIEFPIVSIVTVLPGASPEVVEKEVTEVLEEEINTIEGIKTLTSASVEQVSRISVEFNLDRDINVASQDVRDKIARVRGELPEDAEEPIVSKLDLDAQAIMWMSLNAEGANLRTLTEYADNVVKERLQRLPGVGSILIGGEKRFAIRVRLDAQQLSAHEVTVDDVVTALRRENVEIPSGRIENQAREFVVKTEGEFPSVEAFNELIVTYRRDAPIRLRELGVAEEGDENERSLNRFNLKPAISLGVLKQSNANTVAVATAVRAEIEALQSTLPAGFHLQISFDSARFIQESIDEVQQSLLVSFVLVVLVILLFLHTPRSTIIPSLAIPGSILATFGAMHFLGFTINNLTLLALTLSIGVVVDDAIIVLENVHRHMENGESRLEAALRGTDEIAFAAIAATVTLVVVFLPVAFVTGVVGRFFFEFGVTTAIAVLVSGVVALSLTPMLCARWLRIDEPRGVFRLFERGVSRAAARYRQLLGWVLDHRALIALLSISTLFASAALLRGLGKEFTPQEDRDGFMVVVESPEGSTLGHHDKLQWRVEKLIVETPEVRAATAFIGFSGGSAGAVNRGMIFVRLHPRATRARSQSEILTKLREQFASQAGARIFAIPFSGIPTGSQGKPLQFVIQNPDFAALREHSQKLLERARQIPGLTDVDSDLRVNKPELRVHIDRNKAAALGVTVSDIANTLRILLAGSDVTKFRRGNERYDVIVQLERGDRVTPDQLGQIYVRSRSGELVPLASVLEVSEGVGPSSVNHYNRRRSVIIDGNVPGKPLGTAISELEEIARATLPAGFTTTVAGESKTYAESFSSLAFTFLLATVVVYLVLAAQFESFVDPFTILLALPLAVFGALLALLAAGMTLNVYSFIGLILLVGLVTKNSILLVDYANSRRALGSDLRQAVIEAGSVRLRPILMTAISTLVGVLPTALGIGAGAESRRPLGVTVAGGVTVSTILTLVVVPVFYTLADDALAWARARLGWHSPPAAVPDTTQA